MSGEQLVRPTATSYVSRADFRRAFRHVPGPVAVVLVRCGNGAISGITCTSATSLSASPPMVVLSVDAKTSFAEEVRGTRRYSVNYLAADRAEWARAFAVGGASLESLVHVIGQGRSGIPKLSSGTTAVLECELVDALVGGDHWILTGSIIRARTQTDAPALMYLDGEYGQFRPDAKSDGAAPDLSAGPGNGR